MAEINPEVFKERFLTNLAVKRKMANDRFPMTAGRLQVALDKTFASFVKKDVVVADVPLHPDFEEKDPDGNDCSSDPNEIDTVAEV
jgi:hypothetical protein